MTAAAAAESAVLTEEDLPDSRAAPVPEVGMEFENEDEAYSFYNEYAGTVGFSVRKSWKYCGGGTAKVVVKRMFVCSSEGFRQKKRLANEVKNPRPITRTGCPARMVIRVTPICRYRVCEFEPKHNHMTVVSSRTHMSRLQRGRTNTRDAQADSDKQAGGRRSLKFLSPDYRRIEKQSGIDDDRIAAFRNGFPPLASSHSLIIPPRAFSIPPSTPVVLFRNVPFSSHDPSATTTTPPAVNSIHSGSITSATNSFSSIEKQFRGFRAQLEDSRSVRERIRMVTMEMGSTIGLMHSSILLVHKSLSVPELLEKARVQIGMLKELFRQLTEILNKCRGKYYKYHEDWRNEAQTAVSLLAFLHWLERGSLLLHVEAEEKLGYASEFGLDVEDYLIGLCFMSNELPSYVVKQVTVGDCDCPRKVLELLTDLHAAFQMLNLQTDLLQKVFDGMKSDLRRVEGVFYDVKIRGLAARDSSQDRTTQPKGL